MPADPGAAVRTLDGLVARAAATAGDRPALVHRDVRLTWTELDGAVDRAAAGYCAAGPVPGDRVAVQLPHRDDDGDLHLVDRRGDLILVRGFSVYPGEEERVLGEHPGVAEFAVIGVADARTGEAVEAVVVRAEGAQVSSVDLLAVAARSLARFTVPRTVHFVPALPHSLTSKISRARLRELGMTGAADG